MSNKGRNAQVVARAGIWYTICNFAFKGMAFITTPIFARLLTKTELGSFSNYASWITILTVLTSFDLHTSIVRSKLEHEDDIDSYIWSILSFSSIATLCIYAVVCCFSDFFVNLFQMDMMYIHLMFIYLLISPAYNMLITKHRAFYKYKTFVVITGIMMLVSTALSLILVILMRDKLLARVVGHYLPPIIMGAVIYVMIIVRGKKIKISYWKYACVMCLPLVPHTLSMYLLSSSDKIIITNICGQEYTAIYSIAYSCYHIVSILFDSMNKAWAPWLLESLHYEKYDEIKKTSKIYILLFAAMSIGVLLVAPEVILILGGRQYNSAVYCMPPLIAGCVFQFVYTMYVNIEFYEKKTIGVAGATIAATVLNIALNFIFIPRTVENGYVVAAYTTLTGYIVLLLLHYLLVKRLHMEFVYDRKFICGILVAFLAVAAAANVLYNFAIIRYVLIVVYGAFILAMFLKNKELVLSIVWKRKKK